MWYHIPSLILKVFWLKNYSDRLNYSLGVLKHPPSWVYEFKETFQELDNKLLVIRTIEVF